MALATLLVLLLVAALLAFLAVRVARDTPDRVELARLQTRDEDFQSASGLLQEKTDRILTLETEKAKLAADLENERRSSVEKLRILQEAEARLKTEFENLANRILEDKGRSLSDRNRERLAELLQPFKEQIESFRKRVDAVHQDGTEQSARLLEQIRQLQALSNRVSEDANNLARAIQGDAKRQGDWGELLVERIFEASGLHRGRDYEGQCAFRAEDGSLRRPDFIVRLPRDKAVIVDSKVSLTAFDRYCAARDDDARHKALAEHVQSVRQHVTELQAAGYEQLLGNRTLDFVLLCIPLEPAFQAALQADPDLLYDLARTKIVITGPTTLLLSLKLIAQIWRREHENRNAERIADRAGRLYDQVALVLEAVADAQKRLTGVAEAFDLVQKRLREGRGNLVGRVEELRKLGAKVSKPLPPGLAAAALQDAESAEDPEGADAPEAEEAPESAEASARFGNPEC